MAVNVNPKSGHEMVRGQRDQAGLLIDLADDIHGADAPVFAGC